MPHGTCAIGLRVRITLVGLSLWSGLKHQRSLCSHGKSTALQWLHGQAVLLPLTYGVEPVTVKHPLAALFSGGKCDISVWSVSQNCAQLSHLANVNPENLRGGVTCLKPQGEERECGFPVFWSRGISFFSQISHDLPPQCS